MTIDKKKNKIVSTARINLKKVMPADAYSQKILMERASALAKVEVDEHDKKSKLVNYIKFKLISGELYGIPYAEVEDVKNIENITRVPKAPHYIAGIHYWHGKIIPVINLAKYFGIVDHQEASASLFVATVSSKNLMIGFVFHDVIGVDSYLESDLDGNIAASSGIKDKYIYGIHSGKTTILNARNILADISADLMTKKGNGHE